MKRGPVYCTTTIRVEVPVEVVVLYDEDNCAELSSSALRLGTERLELSTEAQSVVIDDGALARAVAQCDPDRQRADEWADAHDYEDEERL